MKRRTATRNDVGESAEKARHVEMTGKHKQRRSVNGALLIRLSVTVLATSLTLLTMTTYPDVSPYRNQTIVSVRKEISTKDAPSSPRPRHGHGAIQKHDRPTTSRSSAAAATPPSCAICFFGLPRSFQQLVLPSIVQNILKPNQRASNHCDIYLHYYKLNSEGKSRSSAGGTLDTEQVWLLQDAVQRLYNQQFKDEQSNKVHLTIISDMEDSFQQKRGEQLQKYLTTKEGPDGKLLYYPWMAKSYDKQSVENVVKQWHSISQVWSAMEEGARQLNRNYTRVAMMRNDVVYVTPFDIYQVSNTTRDDANQQVVVPNWARFPINDRMVYGPYDAIKIWATERFDRLETHVRTYEEPGYGLHSERFLNHSIFPPIRALGYEVTANPELCFFRARADGTAWINDCATRDGAALGFRNLNHAQRLVEELVGHDCVRGKFKQRIVQVDCNVNATGVTTS